MASLTQSKRSKRKQTPLLAEGQYFQSNFSKLHPAQTKLIELTNQQPNCNMLAGADSTLLLTNMLRFAGAKRCIDVGVFTGYSSLSWALNIPEDGKVIACDISLEFAQVGMPIWKEAGVDHKIDLKIAEADKTLQALLDAGEAGTYDFMFIDADKTGYDMYYELGLKLLRPQGIIAVDNTVWDGKVTDPDDMTENTVAIRKLNLKIQDDPRVSAVMVDISDGLYVCLKN